MIASKSVGVIDSNDECEHIFSMADSHTMKYQKNMFHVLATLDATIMAGISSVRATLANSRIS